MEVITAELPVSPPPIGNTTVTLSPTEAYDLEAFLHAATQTRLTRLGRDIRGQDAATSLYFKLPCNR